MERDLRREAKVEKKIKYGLLGITVLLLAFLEFLVPGLYGDLWELLTLGDIDRISEMLLSYGPWAMVISFILDVLINAVGFLPSIFISTANGLIFGIVPGIIISWLAETVGVVISFLIMRYLLRGLAEEVIQKSDFLLKLDDFSGSKGLQMMLIARTIPYFPSGIITALGAISRISLRDYIIANLIGKFPSTALEVVLGHDIVLFEENLGRLSMVVIGAIVVYGLVWWVYKRMRHK